MTLPSPTTSAAATEAPAPQPSSEQDPAAQAALARHIRRDAAQAQHIRREAARAGEALPSGTLQSGTPSQDAAEPRHPTDPVIGTGSERVQLGLIGGSWQEITQNPDGQITLSATWEVLRSVGDDGVSFEPVGNPLHALMPPASPAEIEHSGPVATGPQASDPVPPAELLGDAPIAPAAAQSRAVRIFKATLTQAVSTGMTFGLKPIVEALVKELVIAIARRSQTDPDPEALDKLSTAIANTLGGVFVGAIHSAVSASMSAYMNGKIGGPTYASKVEGPANDAADAISVDAPVYLAFTSTFATKQALMQSTTSGAADNLLSKNIWAKAGANATASVAGGAIQGAITDIIKSSAENLFERRPAAPISTRDLCTEVKGNFKKFYDTGEGARFTRNIAGKVLGGAAGMVASTYAGPAASESAKKMGASVSLQGAASGASGMLAFLTGWFGGAHAFGMIADARSRQPEVAIAPAPDQQSESSSDEAVIPPPSSPAENV